MIVCVVFSHLLMHCAGSKITRTVLESDFFQRSKNVGIYLSCQKLREVDTSDIVQALLDGQHSCSARN